MSAAPPPHDVLAEQAVLSAALLDQGALAAARASLRPEHFYVPAHRLVWAAALDLADGGHPVDVVTVASKLRATGALERAGGVPYLAQLVDAVPSVANAGDYARLVLERARMRALIAECQRIAAEGYGDVGDGDVWRRAALGRLLEHARQADGPASPRPLGELAQGAVREAVEALQHGGPRARISSGLRALDDLTGGFDGGQLVLIAARPGMGKTALLASLALGATRGARPVASLLVSLEMTGAEVARRVVCSEARVGVYDARKGRLGIGELTQLEHAARALAPAPVYLTDRTASLAQIDAHVTHLAAERVRAGGPPLGLVGVDYVQLVKPAAGAKGRSREQEVAEISRGLKQLAKDHGVCVVALSQLSRKPEERANKRPNMGDLRESGQLEQDADVIAFLYRDEYYHPDSHDKGIVEIGIGKQRDGATGVGRLGFDKQSIAFFDLAPYLTRAGAAE